MRITVSVLLLLVMGIASAEADTGARLRGTSAAEARLIENTLARSETARALADWIESSDLIVYVQLTPELRKDHAATRLVTAAGPNRYLRIVIGMLTHPADRGALLAHELQHAVEIGRAAEVRSDQALRRLYAEIGENRSARFDFETAAAREVAARVQREVAATRRAAAEARGASGS